MDIATIRERVSKTLSPRAQVGLIILFSLIALVVTLDLSSRNRLIHQQLVTVETELAGRRSALEERDWSTVLGAASAEVDAIETRFWRGATSGLVSAQILGAVETAAETAQLSAPRVSVLRSEVLAEGAVLFEVEVSARSNDGGFATFLEAITQAEAELRPAQLEWQGRNRPVAIRLFAPAIIEEAASQ